MDANRKKSFAARAEADEIAILRNERTLLRNEIRVARQASHITAQMVVRQFEKTETILQQFRSMSGQLQAVLDAASQISIIACDANGLITLFNRGAESLLGYTSKEMVGKHSILDIHDKSEFSVHVSGASGKEKSASAIKKARHKHQLDIIKTLAKSGTPSEWSYVRKDGSSFPVELSITEIMGSDGQLAGYLSVGMDMTERKMTEERLRQSNEELKKLDSLKSDFLSSVSHELRTPLTSIRGFVTLVEREFTRTFSPLADHDPKSVKKAQRIKDNLGIVLEESERLTRLINNLLDLAKIESGRVDWNDSVISISDLIEKAVNAVRGQADTHPNVVFEVHCEEGLPPIQSDKDRLIQVVVNLVNNAFKFTEKGVISVNVNWDYSGGIKFVVSDTGCGFPQEQADKIFDKFYQVCQADTIENKPAGTGLGLSICREIVEHYGGRIWAQSTPGFGSVFSFVLPSTVFVTTEEEEIEQVESVETGVEESKVEMEIVPSDGSAPLALVVDDDKAVRDYIIQLLQEEGFRVTWATNGMEAIDTALRHKPDLITMDLLMPVMGGKEAVEKIRHDPLLSDVPIIVVSVLPITDQKKVGGDAMITKPIDESLLINTARMFTRHKTRVQPEPGPAQQCLVVYEDSRRVTQESFSFSVKISDYCTPAQLMVRLREGFKGMVVIPAELLEKVDIENLENINTNGGVQYLILPPERSGEKNDSDKPEPLLRSDI